MDVLRDQVVHARLYPAVQDAVPVVADTGGVVIGDKMLQLGYVIKCSSEEMKALFPDLQTKIIPAEKLAVERSAGVGRQTSGSGWQTDVVPPPPLMSVVMSSTALAATGGGRGLMGEGDQREHCNNNAAFNQ